MSQIKRTWDIISAEERGRYIKNIIAYFKTERQEEIGRITAENILDFFLEMAAENIYNTAVEDARELLKKQFESLEIELDQLLKTAS